jgi:hypothetical protein
MSLSCILCVIQYVAKQMNQVNFEFEHHGVHCELEL